MEQARLSDDKSARNQELASIASATSEADLGAGAGFLLLSTGSGRRQLLWDCLDSIRRHYPHAPIHVVSDVPIQGKQITGTWIAGWTGLQSRYLKTQLNRFTPFQVTAFIDDDAVIHRPFGEAASWLTEADLALSSDYPRIPLHRTHPQIRKDPETQAMCRGRENWVYHNTGVMLFRRSISSDTLFNSWHHEWLRTQRKDQPALLRARVKTGVNIQTLPPSMNFVPHHDAKGKPISEWNAGHILHWTTKKNRSPVKYFDSMGLQRGKPLAIYQAFANAVDHGLCDRLQYEEIGRTIKSLAPGKVLIFGTGADSQLWNMLNEGGHTLFVEDSPTWAQSARAKGCNVVSFSYPTRRGIAATSHQLDSIASSITTKEWDFIFIDGPQGSKEHSPGRELPIVFAAQCQTSSIIMLHDFERAWESAVAMRNLGAPDWVIRGECGKGSLAIWRRHSGQRI